MNGRENIMSKVRLAAISGGTLACAMGIGHFMQIGGGPDVTSAPVVSAQSVVEGAAIEAEVEKPDVTDAEAPDAAALAAPEAPRPEDMTLSEIEMTSALPRPPASRGIPAPLPSPPLTRVALEDAPISVPPSEEPTPNFACEYDMQAETVAAAMVRLTLTVPCMTNERFTLHHNGMMFTGATDLSGTSEMLVPALSEKPVFIAAFANGEGAVANAEVTSLEYYDRVVVQWKGAGGLQIHALEYGAGYEDEGHVWAEASRDMAVAARGNGGFLTRLGDPEMAEPLMAEVYTFPSGIAKRDGAVSIRVEAEVTRGNCERDVEAQAIELAEDGKLQAQDLVLSMPGCNAVGDYLVLKNLVEDLSIARN